MKITHVRTWIIGTPSPSWGGSQWYFLKIETDDGICGWGEVALLGALRGIETGFHATVDGIARRHLIGRSPLAIEACIPNFLIQESICRSGGFFDELLDQPFDWSGGYLTVPDGPGLGVNLREEALEEYRVA